MNNNIKSRNLLVGIDYAKGQSKSKIDFLKTKCNKCGNEIKYKLAIRDIKNVEEYIEQLQTKANKYDSLVEKIKDKINKEELPLAIVGGRSNSKTLNYGIKLGRKQVLQELLNE